MKFVGLFIRSIFRDTKSILYLWSRIVFQLKILKELNESLICYVQVGIIKTGCFAVALLYIPPFLCIKIYKKGEK